VLWTEIKKEGKEEVTREKWRGNEIGHAIYTNFH
jgi:hypothetical protein